MEVTKNQQEVIMREIRMILDAMPVRDGAGVSLKRIFGYHNKPAFDPFLMLDDFSNDDPQNYLAGFPMHPHRGIETITYLLEGYAEHEDSLGNKGTIGKGEVQWMTAGSGIIHQEMPKPDSQGRMYGFQLWTNLPASHKMMPPRYQDIKAEQIPCIQAAEGVVIKLICGEYMGTRGPVEDIMIDPQYWDLRMDAHAEFIIPTPVEYTAFIYCYHGEVVIKGKQLHKHQIMLFDNGLGIKLHTEESEAKLLFCSGKALREPIAWRGPIVMNTAEEIKNAFDELGNGSFIR